MGTGFRLFIERLGRARVTIHRARTPNPVDTTKTTAGGAEEAPITATLMPIMVSAKALA